MNKSIDINIQNREMQKGFSLIELIIVMAIIGLLAAIAGPNIFIWRETLDCRSSARDVSIKLRNARSRAITENKQDGLEVDTVNGQYRLRQGDRAVNSPWADVAQTPPVGEWIPLPGKVAFSTVNVPAPVIAFNPNGTSNVAASGDIRIHDKAGTIRFEVTVTSFGKISIK